MSWQAGLSGDDRERGHPSVGLCLWGGRGDLGGGLCRKVGSPGIAGGSFTDCPFGLLGHSVSLAQRALILQLFPRSLAHLCTATILGGAWPLVCL